ncbi:MULTISPECIES: glycosyltransferase family 2 protein [Pseudovibrio]|uniref:glycosyltransferase family 2 protein n=1 Tax=Stappiaceae TaxID=2821832 RepID=UPI0023651426|nr:MULTISPECIES: glycosyltransferase family 2 protein [Pseudovibrio]MDD7908436.1 glycosyltransferase family 2 protein [Pseudovibrio exalbescens]MDX5592637.1 glycosyltransferase family 2 protein [Pseudovibrio sp. SPO723]
MNGGRTRGAPEISVVIPAKDERDNLPILLDEIAAALHSHQFEVLVVDDGSTDGTGEVLKDYGRENTFLRVLRHDRSGGQSCAVRSGLCHARGAIIITIDGDGENDPAYMPELLAALNAGGETVGLAAGQRLGRKASLFKRYASKAANKLRGAMLKDNTRDSGCGLKAIRTDVFKRLPYFDGWHRFLPALVIREGFGVVHVDIVDRQRRHGVSNYGIWDRALVGILDLYGVWWLRRRRRSLPSISEVEIERPAVQSREFAEQA